MIEDGSRIKGSCQYASDFYLTSDGLLLCTGDAFAGALGAIYDLETGDCIFRGECWYQYDEVSGTLLYMHSDIYTGDSSTLHGARRDSNGVFQDVYTIELQDPVSSLIENVRCMDSRYILLSTGGCCEMYEIATGIHVMTVYNPDGIGGFGKHYLVDGSIINLQYHKSNTVTAYPYIEFSQLVEQAEAFLTSSLGTRQLTDIERKAYYIE